MWIRNKSCMLYRSRHRPFQDEIPRLSFHDARNNPAFRIRQLHRAIQSRSTDCRFFHRGFLNGSYRPQTPRCRMLPEFRTAVCQMFHDVQAPAKPVQRSSAVECACSDNHRICTPATHRPNRAGTEDRVARHLRANIRNREIPGPDASHPKPRQPVWQPARPCA